MTEYRSLKKLRIRLFRHLSTLYSVLFTQKSPPSSILPPEGDTRGISSKLVKQKYSFQKTNPSPSAKYPPLGGGEGGGR
jgi:hypothetical protein